MMVFFIVSVPPHQILVYDASGRDVSGAVGPLYEGDSLVLSCEVRGGKSNEFHFSTFFRIISDRWWMSQIKFKSITQLVK